MLPDEALNKYRIKDIQSLSIIDTRDNKTIMTLDVPYSKDDNLSDTIIKQSINTYVKHLINEGIDDADILQGCTLDGFQDDYIDQKRIYKFSSTQDGKKYAICTNQCDICTNYDRPQTRWQEIKDKDTKDTMTKDYIKCQDKWLSVPTLPVMSKPIVIEEKFELLNIFADLFPKCEFCGKRHIFWLNGYSNYNTYLCNKCCIAYGIIGTKEYKENRYNAIEKIRKCVKDDLHSKRIEWED